MIALLGLDDLGAVPLTHPNILYILRYGISFDPLCIGPFNGVQQRLNLHPGDATHDRILHYRISQMPNSLLIELFEIKILSQIQKHRIIFEAIAIFDFICLLFRLFV